MSSPSNLYAEKVFSEHPTVLWALDDRADYISVINEDDREISSWSITGGFSQLDTTVIDEPFIDSQTTKITGSVIPSGEFGRIELVSNDIINFTELNSFLSTFSVGTYLYSLSSYIYSVEIGYQYYDTTTGTNISKLKNYNTSITNEWLFFSETFDIPSENTTLRLMIVINYLGGATSEVDNEFLINGLSFGQWSEEFNAVSLGSEKILVPSEIDLPESFGIVAESYGLQRTPGYYLVSDNALTAKNSGVPLVYGASNSTILSSNDGLPSLIIPGYGFLNENGKFKEYTLEMWMRINCDSKIKKRIVGPIGSDDGIYVDGSFITLKIDNNYGSYFVGEWVRPMLIHIRITNNSANLLINGEQVISLNFITKDLSFPDKFNNNKDQDWLGFYAYEDVSPIEIDCVAIYPYQVPSLVAKRRFVYGQGVEIPENINTAYSGTSTFIDYPFANYSNNYMYPDIGRWSQASIDNLSSDNNLLSVPDYQLPEIILNNKTKDQFLTSNTVAQNEEQLFVTFKPDESWSETEGYFYFDNLNPLSSNTRSFYGVFSISNHKDSTQTLLRVVDQNTNNYFSIELTDDRIDYKLFFGNQEEVIYTSYGVLSNTKFTAGIDLKTFVSYFGGNVSSFFGNVAGLKVYVGGSKEFLNTFEGNIYSIGFCSDRNFNKINYIFNDLGVPVDFENIFNLYSSNIEFDGGEDVTAIGGYYNNDGEFIKINSSFWQYYLNGGSPGDFSTEMLIDHIASYTLVPRIYFNNFSLDIDIDGYWEDNIPLTYFAKYVSDVKGKQFYNLDFIQFNINYPAPSVYLEKESTGSWNYGELQFEYSSPIQRTYESLDNYLYTGYIDYSDLQNKAIKNYSYDTENSMVKSYVTFQYTKNGANASQDFFINTESAIKDGIVNPGSHWFNTKYEVVDNMIIYPPKSANFEDLSIVVHLNFQVKGIINNPVKIRKMQLASQALDSSSPKFIGTRFGNPIYPYKKTGVYYDYKSENPYSIYKGSSPYLYLTRNSGIQVRGTFDPLVNRGLSIPINKEESNNFNVMAMQIATRFDQDFFPYAPTQIFEIQSKNSLIKFYMVANHPSGKRAKIYAINANTGKLENGIAFYLNGKIVKEPTITIKEWAIIGISFSSLLNFGNYVGAIQINGPLMVNLISHYQSTNLQEVQNVTTRPWFKVKFSGPLTLEWDYWDSAFLWQGVLIFSRTSYYGVKPSDIYKSYAGTNKIIVDDYRESDTSPKILSFKDYEYNLYMNAGWRSQVLNAV
jgi:hypothetical protein